MKQSIFKTLFVALALVLALPAMAEMKNVKVEETKGEKVTSNELQRIHAAVLEGLANMPYVNILDKTNDGAEADLIFNCTVDSMVTYVKDPKAEKREWITEISMKGTIRPADGEGYPMGKDLHMYSTMVLASYPTADAAKQSAFEWMPERVERAFWPLFAIRGKFLSVEEVKKDKAERVSVEVGTIKGAKEGQDFDVYPPDPMLKDKAGRPVENKAIGKVKVEDLGDDISVCKVKGGGDKIQAAYNATPEGLTVMSKGPSKGLIKDSKYKAQVVAENIYYYSKIIEETAKAGSDAYNSAKDFHKEVFK